MMHTTRGNRQARCPACSRRSTARQTRTGDTTPKADDLSVCAYCSSLLVFNTDLTLRSMSQAELEALPAQERATLSLYRFVVAAANHQRSMR